MTVTGVYTCSWIKQHPWVTKLPWTHSFWKLFCIVLPSDSTHCPYLNVPIVLRLCRFPSSSFIKDEMIYGPQTMNNSHFSHHIQCSVEDCLLDCPFLSIIVWVYNILKDIKEKIPKLLGKKCCCRVVICPIVLETAKESLCLDVIHSEEMENSWLVQNWLGCIICSYLQQQLKKTVKLCSQ